MVKIKKIWAIVFLILSGTIALSMALLVFFVDPSFHYRKPADGISYRLNHPRYTNDGILRHFDYEGVIAGSSMIENFKTADFNSIFGVTSVKVPYSGATLKEVNRGVMRALENKNIKVVLRGLDYNQILMDKDYMRYPDSYFPDYLYDEDPINDINYLLNKSVLGDVAYNIYYNIKGIPSSGFDEYNYWDENQEYGREVVLSNYERPEKKESSMELSDEEIDRIRQHVRQNVTDAAKENPEVDFYYFISPYSILYFDSLNQEGVLEKTLKAEKIFIEEILPYENIHLFSFFDNFELISDLENYFDPWHYTHKINKQILYWMKDGKYQLTRDNYKDYCKREWDYYTNFDYDSLFGLNDRK